MTHLTVKNGIFKKCQKSSIRFLGQKVCPVACLRTDRQTDTQTDYCGHPFRVSGCFPSTYYQGSAQYYIICSMAYCVQRLENHIIKINYPVVLITKKRQVRESVTIQQTPEEDLLNRRDDWRQVKLALVRLCLS